MAHEVPLLDDFPLFKRPKFDVQFNALPFALRRKFVLEQKKLYKEFNIDYIAGETKTDFEQFKTFSDENPTRDDLFLSQFPFDPKTIEQLVDIMKDQRVMKKFRTAHERLVSQHKGSNIWYTNLQLDLNFFDEIDYYLPDFTIKFRELDYLQHMINACTFHLQKIDSSNGTATAEDATYLAECFKND